MLDGRGNIDKELVHNSWLDMKSILDNEMPVTVHKKRRFFLILFFILIGGVSSLWVMSSLLNDNGEISSDHAQEQNIIPATNNYHDLENSKLSDSDTPSVVNTTGEFATKNLTKENNENKRLIVPEYHDSNETDNPKTVKKADIIEGKKDVVGNVIVDSQNEATADNLQIGNDNIDEERTLREDGVISDGVRGHLGFPLLVNRPFTSFRTEVPVFDNRIIVSPLSTFGGFGMYVNSRVLEYQNFNLELGLGYDFSFRNDLILFGRVGYGIDSYKEEASSLTSSRISFSGNIELENKFNNILSSSNLVKGNYFSMDAGLKVPILNRLDIIGAIQYRLYEGSTQNSQLDASVPEEDVTSPTQSGDMSASYQLIFKNQNDLYLRLGIGIRVNYKIYLNISYFQQTNSPYKFELSNYNLDQTTEIFKKRKEFRFGMTYYF